MYSMVSATRLAHPTGVTSRATFAIIATLLVGTGSVYDFERTETWRHHIQPRVDFIVDATNEPNENGTRLDIRTAGEHIENIRSALSPPVSDLAALFDVSRQSVYKWVAGSSIPEEDKLEKIKELSRIADAFRLAGVSRAGSLLKMKAFGGRSLMDLIKSDQNRPEHVASLIDEARTMESSYAQSGLASSKSQPTNDWQSSVSIPGTTERS